MYDKLSTEHEKLQRKFNQMRRNLDSVANVNASDKANASAVAAMKEAYEK